MAKHRAGWGRLPNAIIQDPGISITEKTVLLLLTSYLPNPRPPIRLIAEQLSLSISTIKRTIRSLEEKQLIRVSRYGIRGKSNEYEIVCSVENYHIKGFTHDTLNPVRGSKMNIKGFTHDPLRGSPMTPQEDNKDKEYKFENFSDVENYTSPPKDVVDRLSKIGLLKEL